MGATRNHVVSGSLGELTPLRAGMTLRPVISKLHDYQMEVSTGGSYAIGKYGEIITGMFLRAQGIDPTEQYLYKDEDGISHTVDFFDDKSRIAYEVKTGRFRSSARKEFRIDCLRFAVESGQFAEVKFVNVPFLGRVGFDATILRLIDGFRLITLSESYVFETGYRTPSPEPVRSLSLQELLKLAEKHTSGPNPGFSREHILLAFMTIGNSGTISREQLRLKSGLGGGSVRTVLKKFRRGGYVRADPFGCHLTESGEALYRSTLKKLSPFLSLDGSQLSVGKSQVGILVRSMAASITSGIEQRDAAIVTGAIGATTYVIRGGGFSIPGGSSDCEKDFPSKAWPTLREKLRPKNGDAVIVCGARDDTTARLGALSAALTLL